MTLTPADIVTAALDLMDRYGLPDLSMRRVASELGVHVGGLYHHVPDKQSLLAQVAERILGEVPETEIPGRPGLHAWADAARQVLLAHRDSGELVITVLGFGLIDRQLTDEPRRLLMGLLAAQQCELGVMTLQSYLLGEVCQEQAARDLAQFAKAGNRSAADSGERFHAGIDLILDGLRL